MSTNLKDGFSIEHALHMYASSFVHMPAMALYDKTILDQFKDVSKNCHIYIIGLLPKAEIVDIHEDNQQLNLKIIILKQEYTLRYPMPASATIHNEGDYLTIEYRGEVLSIPDHVIIRDALNKANGLGFKVLYIGQAYGKDGKRNAVDRLTKHETLQKISVQGIPDGYNLHLLLLEIQPENQIISIISGLKKRVNEDSRISAGLDKLYNTNAKERITLYEAALIRYFQPKFNTEFINSFPSTNLKVLSDCYDKDFAAVIAEISIDELPFMLHTDKIGLQSSHIAAHDLHSEEDRKAFFMPNQTS